MAAHSSQLAPLSAAERPYGHPISRDRGGTSESWDSTIGTWHNSLQKMIQKNDSTSLFSFSKKSLTTKCFQMINWGSSTFFNFDPQAAKPRAAVTRVALSFTEMLLGLPGFSALSWNLATYIYIYIYIYRYIYIYTYLYILYIWIHVYIYIYIYTYTVITDIIYYKCQYIYLDFLTWKSMEKVTVPCSSGELPAQSPLFLWRVQSLNISKGCQVAGITGPVAVIRDTSCTSIWHPLLRVCVRAILMNWTPSPHVQFSGHTDRMPKVKSNHLHGNRPGENQVSTVSTLEVSTYSNMLRPPV